MTRTACFALLIGLALAGCRRAQPEAAPQTGNAPPPPAGGHDSATAVQGEMRDVDFHIEDGIVLHIKELRGALIPSRPGAPPALDDKQSFTLQIRSAQIDIDTASLSTLLNRHVFGYPDSPLRNLRVTTDGDQVIQTGTMKGVHFRIRAEMSLTPDGEIRLHPTAVKVLGVNVRGLMGFFGVHLKGMLTLRPGHGARIDQDDFLLDPIAMLPPPRIQGRLSAIKVTLGGIAQTFGGADSTAPLHPSGSATSNYMYFRGGTLRFGKLTMTDADLEILDEDPSNPLDFSLDRYNEQLVAGYSNNTAGHGLIVHMPDARTLRAGARTQAAGAGGTPPPSRQ